MRARPWLCLLFPAVAATAYLMPLAPPAQLGWLYMGLHLALTAVMLAVWTRGAADAAWVLAAGGLARLLLIGVPPFTSHDIERYLWDGRVWLAGFDPYRLAPDAPALAPLRALWPTPAEHAAYPTLYPPAALALFALAADAGLPLATLVWKSATAGASLATLAVATSVLRAIGAERHLALVALSPLLVLEAGVGGHVDAFAGLAVVVALACAQRRHAGAAGVALGLGTLIKLLPAFALLPLALSLGRRAGTRLVLCALATIGAGYGLSSAAGLRPLGSLVVFFERWSFGSPLGALLARWATPPMARVALLAVLLAGLALAARAARRGRWLVGVQLALAAPLLASPVVFPWYLVPLVPAAAAAPSLALLGWLTALPLTYEVIGPFAQSGVWHPAAWPLWSIALAWAGQLALWSHAAARRRAVRRAAALPAPADSPLPAQASKTCGAPADSPRLVANAQRTGG